MGNKVHPKKKHFEFILNIEPKIKLTSEQEGFFFRNGIEKIPRTNIYTRKSSNFLTMFLCLDCIENDDPHLCLKQLEFTLNKREVQ